MRLNRAKVLFIDLIVRTSREESMVICSSGRKRPQGDIYAFGHMTYACAPAIAQPLDFFLRSGATVPALTQRVTSLITDFAFFSSNVKDELLKRLIQAPRG